MTDQLKVESRGRRWKPMVDSRDLARWLGVDHLLISGDIDYLTLIRSQGWVSRNCWFIRREEVLDYPSRTFTVEKVFWVSQSVAADLCRRYRKDRLSDLAEAFVSAFVHAQVNLIKTFGFVEPIVGRIRQFERRFPWVNDVLEQNREAA